jgi:hypothetical protein
MGALAASVEKMKLSALGRQKVARNAASVQQRWQQIERVVERLPVVPGKTRIYQDGLPACGREQRIVAELAEAGSRNHRLLLWLQDRGAVLMGTESPELLVEEYQLATAALAAEPVPPRARHKPLREMLLERRDRYIADRINGTLGVGETGVLFIGMLHRVDRFLARDIEVVYPLRSGRSR